MLATLLSLKSRLSIFYYLFLLLLKRPYMIAHTTPLFQVIDGDVLCTSDLAYTLLTCQPEKPAPSCHLHLYHKSSRILVPYPIQSRGRRTPNPRLS